MKKMLWAAVLIVALLIALGYWLRSPIVRPPMAAVPVIRRHLPEAHKRVLVVPSHPHRPYSHTP